MLQRILTIILIVFLYSTGISQTKHKPEISNKLWNELLKANVTSAGKVNYEGMVRDSSKLNEYIALLQKQNPEKSGWSREEKLAFWINAYNANTVKLIVDHYPIKSIKDLGGGIYKVNTPWDIKFITIAGEKLDLNNIEHQKIRKVFHEPRIHFALNCASQSCPRLRNEAFESSKIYKQLDEESSYFVNNKTKNVINGSAPQLSKIFSWYAGDFTEKYGSVIAFINKYSNVKINANAKLQFLDYNWQLNK